MGVVSPAPNVAIIRQDTVVGFTDRDFLGPSDVRKDGWGWKGRHACLNSLGEAMRREALYLPLERHAATEMGLINAGIDVLHRLQRITLFRAREVRG